MEHKRNYITMILVGGLWLLLSLVCWLHPSSDYTISERRPLQQRPALTIDSLSNGRFMTDFETYTLDQFPLRDIFRSFKAVSNYYGFGMTDNNGIYFKDGHISKLEYPLNESSITRAAEKFTALYELCPNDAEIYLCIVPDKNYYLADNAPHLDYDRLYALMQQNMPYANAIDLRPLLTLEDYYFTDTHWRQEQLVPVAAYLAQVMETTFEDDFTEEALGVSFYGVYAGQAALPLPSEGITLLHNASIDAASVYNLETDTTGGVYNLAKADSADPYEVYLSGAAAVLQVDNPTVSNGRHLVVFRDSFAGPLIPLLLQGYETVTLLDTRYISSQQAAEFIDAEISDVLFLYSTMILNHATTLR